MPKKRKVQRTGEQEVAYLVKQYLSDKKFTNSLLQFRMEAKSLLPSHQGVINCSSFDGNSAKLR